MFQTLFQTMTRALGLSLSVAIGAGSAGCGGAPTPLTLNGLHAGTTTVRITNNVTAPGQLDRVTIVVDGEVLPLSSVPPDGGAAAVVASLHLAPGSHSLSVRARARAPGSEVIVVGAQQPFLIERGPAAISVDVRSATGASTASDASPIAVSLVILGGRMAPDIGVAPPSEKDERCATLLPIPRALCRAAVDLDDATRKNDIVAALCVRDKLVEMRKLALIGESGKGDSVAMAEAQVTELSAKVELCAADVLSTPAPDGVTVTRPR